VTIPPIVTPLLQWSDADGKPYAGGTITTYIVGTGTPKQTWIDLNQTALNSNPIVLDGAGRSQMFGDGAYRLVLHDAAGNLIADFPATSIVSAAMYPIVTAPTVPDALNLLGVNALISAEATARSNADSAEQAARIAQDAAIAGFLDSLATDLGNTDAAINGEIARATAAEANLQTQITTLSDTVTAVTLQGGIAATDLSGHVRITFPVAFATSVTAFVCSVIGNTTPGPADFTLQATADITGADVYALQGGATATTACDFSWLAAGA
jgi:hypothetical protein